MNRNVERGVSLCPFCLSRVSLGRGSLAVTERVSLLRLEYEEEKRDAGGELHSEGGDEESWLDWESGSMEQSFSAPADSPNGYAEESTPVFGVVL